MRRLELILHFEKFHPHLYLPNLVTTFGLPYYQPLNHSSSPPESNTTPHLTPPPLFSAKPSALPSNRNEMPDPPLSSVPTPDPPPPTPATPSSTTGTPRPFPSRPLAITLLIASTALILIPPRKLDLYTFSLGTAWALSAQHLYTPRARPPAPAQLHPPERASIATSDAAAHSTPRAQHEMDEKRGSARWLWGRERVGRDRRMVSAELERERERERERLEEVGYAGVIGERILEAFGARRDEDEEDGDGKGEQGEKGGASG